MKQMLQICGKSESGIWFKNEQSWSGIQRKSRFQHEKYSLKYSIEGGKGEFGYKSKAKYLFQDRWQKQHRGQREEAAGADGQRPGPFQGHQFNQKRENNNQSCSQIFCSRENRESKVRKQTGGIFGITKFHLKQRNWVFNA